MTHTTLPPEVAYAWAEVLRQATEIAALRESIIGLRAMREDIEAELAALKARVEAAPVFTCDAEVISGRDGDYMSMILTHADPAFQYPDLDDKRVRLVVD